MFFKLAFTVLKSLFSKPATLMYPLKKREYPLATRGTLKIEIAKCIFCGICQKKCPSQAINVVRVKPGTPEAATQRNSWELDHLRCVSCGNCVDACPKDCLMLTNQYQNVTAGQDKEIHYA